MKNIFDFIELFVSQNDLHVRREFSLEDIKYLVIEI